MPYAAVNDVTGALELEHTRARNMVIDVGHAACGRVRLVNTPVKFSEARPRVRTPPQTLGEHTDQVLRRTLGMAEDELKALRADGVIR